MGQVTLKGLFGLALGAIVTGCAVPVSDSVDDDSGTTPGVAGEDASVSGKDSGHKDSIDSSVADSSPVDDGSVEDASVDDSGPDPDAGGGVDGGNPCGKLCASFQACCTLTTSPDYGKCYAKVCLTCCK